jgi:hypothetical protein
MRIERARAEIAPAAPARRHAAPPYAAVPSAPPADRYFSETRPDRPSSSRDHVSLARTAVARLRTTALPDRRARTAVLAALAGIFHEAHAPPLLS